MSRRREVSRDYFTPHPEELTISIVSADEADLLAPGDDPTQHNLDWFELYYTAAVTFEPKRMPYEPGALTGIEVLPMSSPGTDTPYIALYGIYNNLHDSTGRSRAIQAPLPLQIITHGGELDYLSCTSGYDDESDFIDLNLPLSTHIAHIMYNYYQHHGGPRKRPSYEA